MDWDTTVVVFGGAFFVSWIVFAAIYYLISYVRGDFDAQNLPEGEAQLNGTWVPCFYQFHDFTSSYLYSLETQHTIGYGGRQTTEILSAQHAVIDTSCCHHRFGGSVYINTSCGHHRLGG